MYVHKIISTNYIQIFIINSLQKKSNFVVKKNMYKVFHNYGKNNKLAYCTKTYADLTFLQEICSEIL